MGPRIVRGVLIVLLIGGAVSWLLLSGNENAMVYYKTVEEVLQERARFEHEPVRMNGHLRDGSLARKPGTDAWRFILEKNGASLTVEFEGIFPDNAIPGRELVVEGTLIPDADTFRATQILTKCPSKYEARAKAGNR